MAGIDILSDEDEVLCPGPATASKDSPAAKQKEDELVALWSESDEEMVTAEAEKAAKANPPKEAPAPAVVADLSDDEDEMLCPAKAPATPRPPATPQAAQNAAPKAAPSAAGDAAEVPEKASEKPSEKPKKGKDGKAKEKAKPQPKAAEKPPAAAVAPAAPAAPAAAAAPTVAEPEKEPAKVAAQPKVAAKAKSEAKGTKEVKKLSKDEMEAKVLEYMRQQNRPYNSQNVFDNLHGAVPKASVQAIMESLVAEGKLLLKEYGKIKALWFLGSAGPRRESTELLVAVLLREEVYLRRRACEGLGCQGQGMGALGALALRRAVEEDPDVYIQWHASQIYQQLPAELQAKAESSEASEELKSLVAKDALRQQELKKRRKGTVIPCWEPELPEPPPEEEAPTLPAIERQRPTEITTPKELKSPSAPSPTVPANMDAWANSPLSPQTPIEPEAEVVKSFVDTARSRDVFRAFAEGGEINREDLYKALKMLGHVEVNNEWVSAIVKDKFSDRNFLDALDFSKFLAEYEACHMNYVRMKFAEADVDGSGRVDAAELAMVLRRAGFTPITGVVEQLLLEVCGRAMEVTFVNFAKILGIMRYRLGFTLQEYSEIMAAFRREDRSGREKLNLLEARSCLDWLGFDISQEELDAVWQEDLKVQALTANSSQSEEYSINDFDMVRLVRAVREREAHFVARRLRELATRKGQELPEDAAAVVSRAQLPELLSELNVTLASPEVMLEAVEALNLSKAEMTMEDIMPVLWHVRRYQGLSQTELDLAKQQFELCDEDGSGGMACSELEFAIRSLGFPVSYDEVQDQLDTWDMDESGEIEFVEFLKVVSYYKKKELQQVLQNMFTGSFSLSLQKNMTQRRLSKAGELRRGKSELPSVLLSSGHCPLRQDSGVLRSTEEDETELNLWGFSNLISEYRREINDEVRRNHGYTPGEVEELMQLFRVYDPENQGLIAKRQLRRLLLDCVPQAEKSQAGREQIAQMVKESDADRSGSIDFQEFLLLMRLVSNRCSRERLAKERAAVVATHFSVRELREFRKVFKSYATNSGDMSFEELQSMLGSITRAAQGARGSQELLEVLRRYSRGDDGVDFPEFLHVMRDLVAQNWGNINSLTAKAPAAEPTPEVDALLPPMRPAPPAPPPAPPDPPAESGAQVESG